MRARRCDLVRPDAHHGNAFGSGQVPSPSEPGQVQEPHQRFQGDDGRRRRPGPGQGLGADRHRLLHPGTGQVRPVRVFQDFVRRPVGRGKGILLAHVPLPGRFRVRRTFRRCWSCSARVDQGQDSDHPGFRQHYARSCTQNVEARRRVRLLQEFSAVVDETDSLHNDEVFVF